jgi:hypothetical protein
MAKRKSKAPPVFPAGGPVYIPDHLKNGIIGLGEQVCGAETDLTNARKIAEVTGREVECVAITKILESLYQEPSLVVHREAYKIAMLQGYEQLPQGCLVLNGGAAVGG